MCLAKAFDNRSEILMEDIASLKVGDGKLVMKDLFGGQREIKARIKEIDFMTSRVVLEDVKV